MSCAGISFCSFSLLVWSWQKKCLTNILYMSSQGNSCDFFFFFSSAPYAFLLLHTGSSSSPCFDTQALGCCVLSKTRRTTRETAGIPIWSRSDSCSACAASAQRCPSTHTAFINSLKEHYTKNCLKKTLNIWHGAVKKKRLVNCCISSLCVSLSDWPCEVHDNQVSCSAVWQPRGRASAVLSKMHRYDVRHLLIQTPGVTVYVLLVIFCPVWSPTDEPRIPAGLRASVKSCRYNGTIYQPGETFNKHDLFPSKQSNQCVMCTCSVSYI